ncbi:MAG: NUDIX hydrolase [Cyclobacteriaceae bacterium]|nr:NUDIX hydrolase [Cyclobacteriaceae bacterium]
MNALENKIIEMYGNKLRIRVCGVCIEKDAVLVVNHHSLNGGSDFWSPPGGGMEFGISAEENLKREIQEETGLIVEIEKFMWVHEYLAPPLHAIELFFCVRRTGGRLDVGYDPEMNKKNQIIKDVQFMPIAIVKSLPENQVHQALIKLIDQHYSNSDTGYGIYQK